MIVYEDHIEMKLLIDEDMQASIPKDSLKEKRPDGKIEASAENDLCRGSTSHQRWLPR